MAVATHRVCVLHQCPTMRLSPRRHYESHPSWLTMPSPESHLPTLILPHPRWETGIPRNRPQLDSTAMLITLDLSVLVRCELPHSHPPWVRARPRVSARYPTSLPECTSNLVHRAKWAPRLYRTATCPCRSRPAQDWWEGGCLAPCTRLCLAPASAREPWQMTRTKTLQVPVPEAQEVEGGRAVVRRQRSGEGVGRAKTGAWRWRWSSRKVSLCHRRMGLVQQRRPAQSRKSGYIGHRRRREADRSDDVEDVVVFRSKPALSRYIPF